MCGIIKRIRGTIKKYVVVGAIKRMYGTIEEILCRDVALLNKANKLLRMKYNLHNNAVHS